MALGTLKKVADVDATAGTAADGYAVLMLLLMFMLVLADDGNAHVDADAGSG